MIKKRSKTSWARRGVAAALAAVSLMSGAPGAALAEADYITKAEAEEGVLLGGAVITATGTAVSRLEQEGDGVQVTIAAPKAGHYDVIVNQATVGSGEKVNYVTVNGQRVGEVTSPGVKWQDAMVAYVWLEAGENTITVEKSWGWVSVDYIAIRESAPIPADVYDVEPTLVDPDATVEARQLMTFLCDNYGKNVISGQQSQEGPFGLDNQAVWRATNGTYPALLGLDFLSYSPARVKKGDQSKVVESAIEYWNGDKGKRGIVTIAWHWCPDARYDKKDPWSTFYADSTTFNLRKALNGTDKAGYQMLLDDIDAIAVQLKRLQDAGVPVLWRPLHEASGGWFWWGASGPEAYKELYKLMFDRLTNHHGIHNLIWVWNGQHGDWYPGDEYVDVIGEDIYPGEKVYTSQAARFIQALGYTDARKLIALTENGCVPDTDLLKRDNVMWSWWCTWGGEFVRKSEGFNAYSEQYTEKSMLNKVYKHENVITRKNIPDIKTYPLRDE